MAKREHLFLRVEPEVPPRKMRSGGGGYAIAPRDKHEFSRTQIKQLDALKVAVTSQRENLKQYFEPRLIFKVRVDPKQGISDETFRAELRAAGMQTIFASPDKSGYWVVFSEDIQAIKFRQKLENRTKSDKATFIDAILGIGPIPKEEKIGQFLKEQPIGETEVAYLDVELWPMEETRVTPFVTGPFSKLLKSKGGHVLDYMNSDTYCIIRVEASRAACEMLLELFEVCHVDRPPKMKIESLLAVDSEEVEPKSNPNKDAHSILIADSGIRHHPLIRGALASEFAVEASDKRIIEGNPFDDVGHGTMVAGFGLYGQVEDCLTQKQFMQEVWIHSAKIMFRGTDGYARFAEKELLERQLKNAIDRIVKQDPKCKIVNLSLGNSSNKLLPGTRQFILASLVDELALKNDLIFVVSAGNNDEDRSNSERYPDYFQTNKKLRIIDPASAALALTVGSISKYARGSNQTIVSYPSEFTRIGPGLRGMIKPELVEFGGGNGNHIVVLEPDWTAKGRLFNKHEGGTSFSAPVVASYVARLKNKFTDRSNNFIKALLLSSATIPATRPGYLAKIKPTAKAEDAAKLHNVYGYGKPDLDKALFSEDTRVLLVHEGSIPLDRVNCFPIFLPEAFLRTKGERRIDVTLVFDPPVNRRRMDYLGVTMEAHLFKNKSLEEIKREYDRIEEMPPPQDTSAGGPESQGIVPKKNQAIRDCIIPPCKH
ncbi:MAG: S8 family peptidase [Nitrososphaera sp.]